MEEVDPPAAAAAAGVTTRKANAEMLVARIRVERNVYAGEKVTATQKLAIEQFDNVKLQLEAANLQIAELQSDLKKTKVLSPSLPDVPSPCTRAF